MADENNSMPPNVLELDKVENPLSEPEIPILEKNQKIDVVSITNLEMYGYETAGQYKSDEFVYKTHLNKILQGVIAKEDQIERRKKISEEVDHFDVEIKSKKKQAEDTKEKILPVEKNIEEIENEKNQAVTDHDSIEEDRLNYNIGRMILSFLTVYLVIFYSSIIYGAFVWDIMQELVGSNIKDLHLPTIVNLKAIPNTYHDFGFIGVLFILSSTSLFITLGFLFSKWNNDPRHNVKKWSILLFTFLFDTLMAYEIVEKIHLLKYNMGLEMVEWNFTMVFTNINFWIIIFAGFAAYIIWGFVFEFTSEEREKLNPLSKVLEKCDSRIKLHKDAINSIKDKIDEIYSEVLTLETKKHHKVNQMKAIVYDRQTLQKNIDEFTNGWIRYLSGLSDKIANEKKISINSKKQDFLNGLLTSPKNIQSVNS
jgi:hypothetical protein